MARPGECNCAKYFLFTVNVIFFFIGILFIVGGALITSELLDYQEVTSDDFQWSAIGMIGVGVVTTLCSFLGWYGAYTESITLLNTFISMVVSLLVIQIVIIVLAAVQFREVKDVVRRQMEGTVSSVRADGNGQITTVWNRLQRTGECCGIIGPETWVALSPDIPDGCCVEYEQACGENRYRNRGDAALIHQEGCLDTMEEFIKNNVELVGTICASVALLQVLTIIGACYEVRIKLPSIER